MHKKNKKSKAEALSHSFSLLASPFMFSFSLDHKKSTLKDGVDSLSTIKIFRVSESYKIERKQ